MLESLKPRMKAFADSKVAFTSTKVMLASTNLMFMAFSNWLLVTNLSLLSAQEDTESDPKKRELLDVSRTMIIMSTVAANLLCLVGIIGALKEAYGCVVGYGGVLAALLLVTVISPARSRIWNLLILAVMTILALVYAMIIKAREKKAERIVMSATSSDEYVVRLTNA